MRTLRNVVLIMLVAILAVVLLRHVVVREVAAHLIEKHTGFDVDIGRVRTALWRPGVTIEDMELINPPGFPARQALHFERFFVQCDPSSFWSPGAHLEVVEVAVSTVRVVRRPEGEWNIERLARNVETALPPRKVPAAAGPAQSAAPDKTGAIGGEAAPEPASPGEAPAEDVRIDRLAVSIGTLEVLDFRAGGPEPRTLRYPLNIERVFHDVIDLDEVNTVLTTDLLTALGPALLMDLQGGLSLPGSR